MEEIRKDIQSLKESIEMNTSTTGQLNLKVTQLQKDVKGVTEWFDHMNWLKGSSMWFLGFIAAIGAAIAAIKIGMR